MKSLMAILVLGFSGAAFADTIVGLDSYVTCQVDEGALFPVHQIVTDDGSIVYRETHDDLLVTVTAEGGLAWLASIQVSKQGQVVGSSNVAEPFGNLVISARLTNEQEVSCNSI